MKRIIISIIITLLALGCISFLTGCDIIGGDGTGNKDYNKDIETILPEDLPTDNFVIEEDKTYYKSEDLSLCISVNGYYFIMDYFYLDGSKRVYDNLYLYEDDYFYMITGDYKDIYASFGDSADAIYGEEEREQGYDIQINMIKSGVYKLTFDVETLKFDLEYKQEIESPAYYQMKNCSIYTKATEWVEMSASSENSEEFCIKDFNIEKGEYICFYDRTHVSNYKVTLDESVNENCAVADKTFITVNVGGKYDVYVNSKTYVVRLVLKNPDTADYGCVYYDGTDFVELEPSDTAKPYIFKRRMTVDKKFVSVPDFHSTAYKTYKLRIVDSDYIDGDAGYEYFKQAGTYDIIVNLKTFELSVELLPE